MKIKLIILILAILGVSLQSSCFANYYPEMTMSPFYSALNPAYIDDEVDSENDSILDLLKNKKNKNSSSEQTYVEEEVDAFNVLYPGENKKDYYSSSEKQKTKSNNFIQNLFGKKKKNAKRKDLSKLYNSHEIPDEYKVTEEELEENDVLPKDNEEVKKNKNRGADLVKELEAEQKEKEKALTETQEEKKFSFKQIWPFSKNKTQEEEPQKSENSDEIEIFADNMEYFPDRYEVEAIGNAKVTFVKQGVVLNATKIIFNYDRNILKANENVVLMAKGSITEGDFIRIDLNSPEGFFENPITKTQDIVLKAKEAFVYSDRIEEYNGVAKILKDEKLRFASKSFEGYINQVSIPGSDKDVKEIETPTGVYALKAKTIYIDSKEEHEVITIKNADLFIKNKKIATIPSAKIVTNKTNTNVETNIPEFGSKSLLGLHFGPAVVLNIPGGNTLKLAPVVTYGDDKFGIGGIGRFRSEKNMTEAAYGTSKEEFLIRGKHHLAPGLNLRYSRMTNQTEWFLGFRKPKYSATIDYKRNDYVKDLDLNFSQLFVAGLFVDDAPQKHLGDIDGRFRWMTQTHKTFYKYKNAEGNIEFSTALVAQTAATVYTTGDVAGLFRVGPAINTKVGPWKQTAVYLQTAVAGDSPFYFDRYRYGRSNFILIEDLKISKYLSLGYLASIAMNNDYHDDDLFQESRLILSVGPEYAKISIGYDARRRNTMFILTMLVGTKDSEVEFKRSVIKNPQAFGKEKKQNKKKSKKKNYKKYLNDDVKIEV